MIRQDTFAPVSTPAKVFLSLTSGKGKRVQVEMISIEEDISKLDDLFDAQYIGVDTEWKPYFGPQNTTS